MAGQCLPQGELVKDFAWLTKQEIELRVDNHYWDGIKDMLSDY
jgi:large subunit ribosomal protein L46